MNDAALRVLDRSMALTYPNGLPLDRALQRAPLWERAGVPYPPPIEAVRRALLQRVAAGIREAACVRPDPDPNDAFGGVAARIPLGACPACPPGRRLYIGPTSYGLTDFTVEQPVFCTSGPPVRSHLALVLSWTAGQGDEERLPVPFRGFVRGLIAGGSHVPRGDGSWPSVTMRLAMGQTAHPRGSYADCYAVGLEMAQLFYGAHP